MTDSSKIRPKKDTLFSFDAFPKLKPRPQDAPKDTFVKAPPKLSQLRGPTSRRPIDTSESGSFIIDEGDIVEERYETWKNPRITRLFHMLRMLQDRGIYVDAQSYLEGVFAEQGDDQRITYRNLVRMWNDAHQEELESFDVLEVLLDATWGDERIVVPKTVVASGFRVMPDRGWINTEVQREEVSARALAEAAMRRVGGEPPDLLGAAVAYTLLGEDHLFRSGADRQAYDLYDYELYRNDAYSDLRDHPEFYFDDLDPVTKRSVNNRVNNEMALARLRELFARTPFQNIADGMTDASQFFDFGRNLFQNLNLDLSWIDKPAAYVRATLYTVIAARRFAQLGESLVTSRPAEALVHLERAQDLLGRYNARTVIVHNLEDDTSRMLNGLIVKPMDLLVIGDLTRRVQRNIAKLQTGRLPPPRRSR